MDGVTVLNAYNALQFSRTGALIVVLLLFLGLMGMVYFKECEYYHIISYISIALLLLSPIVAVVDFCSHSTPVYQVTIDDSVSFVEFTNKYEVVKVDGKIYSIKEKNNE